MNKSFSYEDLRLVVTFLLKEKNMTQKALAEKMFMDESTLSRYLSGARKPRLEIIVMMAQILDVSTDVLLLGGKEYVDKAKQQKIDHKEANECIDSEKEHTSMIKTETAVKVTKEQIRENRKNTILVQTVSGISCMIFAIYMGLSGAFEAFNQMPVLAYSLLATSILALIALNNALNSRFFPKFRFIMIITGSLLALVFVTITIIAYCSMKIS